MAIRLQRVLIACGLPTIIAIVSFYWLRKRRKAVSIDSTSGSPKQASIEALESTDLESHIPFGCDSIDSIVVKFESKCKDLNSNSTPNCCDTEHTMQLRDNNNSSPDGVSNACDADTRQQFISNNTSNSRADEIDSNDSNHSLGLKRQINCETNGKEYNCKESNENELNCKYNKKIEDNLVFKLSNFSLNDDNKDIHKELNNEMNDNNDDTSSSDSGKDGSDILHPTPVEPIDVPNNLNQLNDNSVIYEFEINGNNDESSSSDSGKEGDSGSDILHPTPVEAPNLSQTNDTVIYEYEIDANNDETSSSDSGKGGSDILHATPVEVPNLNHLNESVIYQFEIPQYLCGRLIGSGGRFVSYVKERTTTSVVINRHHYSSDMKICTLTGTKPAIREALNQIRIRFPIADYPNVTLQQINLLNATQTCAVPQTCQLQLPSGISCDVILSSLVSAGHFFLQQPTHPTYPSLSRLDHYMIQTYSHQNTPLLPNIHSGMICAVPIMGGWYRAVITKVYESEDECDVMFVDYGGYSRLPVSSLRQIRYDFMSLPFQVSECYLANVKPSDPEIGWTAEANALFEELAQGQILQAFIVGYSENGIPLVHLFKVQGIQNVFINQELVKQSYAQWTDTLA